MSSRVIGFDPESPLVVGAELVGVEASSKLRVDLVPAATIALRMGWPVSAARTPPSMIRAGWRARVDLLAGPEPVGMTEPLPGEAEVANAQLTLRSRPMPPECQAALVVGRERTWPGPESLGGYAHRGRSSLAPIRQTVREDRCLSSTPRGGLAVHVDQPDPDDLLGRSRMSAAGCSASGLSSAQPKPYRGRWPERRPRRSGRTRCGAPPAGSGRRRRTRPARGCTWSDGSSSADPGLAGPADDVDRPPRAPACRRDRARGRRRSSGPRRLGLLAWSPAVSSAEPDCLGLAGSFRVARPASGPDTPRRWRRRRG